MHCSLDMLYVFHVYLSRCFYYVVSTLIHIIHFVSNYTDRPSQHASMTVSLAGPSRAADLVLAGAVILSANQRAADVVVDVVDSTSA